MLSKKTDIELVELARAGDDTAFEELTERYRLLALHLALGVVEDEQIALEVLQEARLAAYLALKQLREAKHFRAWFCSIVLNFARNLRREHRVPVYSLEQMLEEQDENEMSSSIAGRDVPDPLEQYSLRDSLVSALQLLSPKIRQVAYLFYYCQYSLPEISVQLGVSLPAVKSRLFQARLHLRKQLAEFAPAYRDSQRVSREERSIHSMNTPAPRFDASALLVFQSASYEAQFIGHEFLSPEHILLGLLHEKSYQQEDMSLEKVREAVQQFYPQALSQDERNAVTQRTNELIELAYQFANRGQHAFIQPNHIVLALKQLNAYVPSPVLSQCGLTLSMEEQGKIATQEKDTQGAKTVPGEETHQRQMLELDQIAKRAQDLQQRWSKDPARQHLAKLAQRVSQRAEEINNERSLTPNETLHIPFADDAKEMLSIAEQKSRQNQQSIVGVSHLLFGFLVTNEEKMARLLTRVQKNFSVLRPQLEQLMENEQSASTARERSYTAAALHVIETAWMNAAHFHSDTVTGIHFLLSMVQLEDDPTTQYLHSLGLYDTVVQEELGLQ